MQSATVPETSVILKEKTKNRIPRMLFHLKWVLPSIGSLNLCTGTQIRYLKSTVFLHAVLNFKILIIRPCIGKSGYAWKTNFYWFFSMSKFLFRKTSQYISPSSCNQGSFKLFHQQISVCKKIIPTFLNDSVLSIGERGLNFRNVDEAVFLLNSQKRSISTTTGFFWTSSESTTIQL